MKFLSCYLKNDYDDKSHSGCFTRIAKTPKANVSQLISHIPGLKMIEFTSLIRSKLKIIIFLYILFIYLSLPFMRDFLNYLYDSVGPEQFKTVSDILLVFFTLAVILLTVKKGFNKLLWVLPPILLTIIYMYFLEFTEERIHLIEYGILGSMVLKTVKERTWKQVGFAFGFVSLIGCGDEFIQWLLPSRVGDFRDIIMNIVGGGLGIWVEKYLYWE